MKSSHLKTRTNAFSQSVPVVGGLLWLWVNHNVLKQGVGEVEMGAQILVRILERETFDN